MFQHTQINVLRLTPSLIVQNFELQNYQKSKKYRASIVRTCSNLFYSLEVFIHTGSCKSKTRIGSVNADSNAIWKPIWKWRQSQPKYIWRQLTALSMSLHEYASWVIILIKFFVDDTIRLLYRANMAHVYPCPVFDMKKFGYWLCLFITLPMCIPNYDWKEILKRILMPDMNLGMIDYHYI